MQTTTLRPTFIQQYDKIVAAYMNNILNPLCPTYCFVGNMFNGSNIFTRLRRYENFTVKPHSWFYRKISSSIQHEIFVRMFENKDNMYFYTLKEIISLEKLFLDTIYRKDREIKRLSNKIHPDSTAWVLYPTAQKRFEDKLYLAMEKTLELLKAIHESKGEEIPSYSFYKRTNYSYSKLQYETFVI